LLQSGVHGSALCAHSMRSPAAEASVRERECRRSRANHGHVALPGL